MLAPWKKSYDKPRQHSRDNTLPTKIHIVKVMAFPVDIMNVRVGPSRRLSTEELMLSNCGAGEDS